MVYNVSVYATGTIEMIVRNGSKFKNRHLEYFISKIFWWRSKYVPSEFLIMMKTIEEKYFYIILNNKFIWFGQTVC